MAQIGFNKFQILPPVVKNLLIINGIFYLATFALGKRFGFDLTHILGLHYIESEAFYPFQYITYMFMHSPQSIWHLVFNMFALWMFGYTLENLWGWKRFLIFYFVTGIGAGLIQTLVQYVEINQLRADLTLEKLNNVVLYGRELFLQGKNYVDPTMGRYNLILNIPTVGASGAVYGILLAFGMLFPNTVLYLYFAIPIKAKWFVLILIGFELFTAISNNPGDNVAHFAHLGGMLFAFVLIKYWNKKLRNNFF